MAVDGQNTTEYRKVPMVVVASNDAVAVPVSGNTDLIEIVTEQIDRIFFEVEVTTNNLDAFIIAGKAHSQGSYHTLFSAAGDYTSPAGILVGASGDLTGVAAAASGWFILDTRGLSSVKVSVSAVTGAATVTARVTGS